LVISKRSTYFFTFDFDDVLEDTEYILQQHFSSAKIDDPSPVNKRTRLRQQRLILELYNYRNCGTEQRQALEAKARQAAMVSAKPIYVFRELMHYMAEQRIVAPGYTYMQDLVGQALTYEQQRLTTILSQYLDQSAVDHLNRLLQDSPGLYEITQLKREPKDFSPSEIKREIHRGEQIRELHYLAQKLLPQLKISNESIKYYASLVGYYSVFRLKQLNEEVAHIYLLCFVYHRYQRLHDNLLGSLIYHVRQYQLTVRPFFSEFPKFQCIEFLGLIRLPNLGGKLTANLPPRLLTAAEARRSLQLVNSRETKLPNLRISFQNKRTVRVYTDFS
jgi:Domain of unknown function (DUF4158)